MIKITDRFYINANSNCYILQEKTKIQDEKSKNYGQEIYKDLGNYVSVEGCLKGMLKALTREYIGKEQINTITELIEFIKQQNKLINNLNISV